MRDNKDSIKTVTSCFFTTQVIRGQLREHYVPNMSEQHGDEVARKLYSFNCNKNNKKETGFNRTGTDALLEKEM